MARGVLDFDLETQSATAGTGEVTVDEPRRLCEIALADGRRPQWNDTA